MIAASDRGQFTACGARSSNAVSYLSCLALPTGLRNKRYETHLAINCEHRRIAIGIAGAHKSHGAVLTHQGRDVGRFKPTTKTAIAMGFNDSGVTLPDNGCPLRIRLYGLHG